MKKKIKDLTLEELENYCEKQQTCQECVFQQTLCINADLVNVLTKCFYKHNHQEVALQEIEVEDEQKIKINNIKRNKR